MRPPSRQLRQRKMNGLCASARAALEPEPTPRAAARRPITSTPRTCAPCSVSREQAVCGVSTRRTRVPTRLAVSSVSSRRVMPRDLPLPPRRGLRRRRASAAAPPGRTSARRRSRRRSRRRASATSCWQISSSAASENDLRAPSARSRAYVTSPLGRGAISGSNASTKPSSCARRSASSGSHGPLGVPHPVPARLARQARGECGEQIAVALARRQIARRGQHRDLGSERVARVQQPLEAVLERGIEAQRTARRHERALGRAQCEHALLGQLAAHAAQCRARAAAASVARTRQSAALRCISPLADDRERIRRAACVAPRRGGAAASLSASAHGVKPCYSLGVRLVAACCWSCCSGPSSRAPMTGTSRGRRRRRRVPARALRAGAAEPSRRRPRSTTAARALSARAARRPGPGVRVRPLAPALSRARRKPRRPCARARRAGAPRAESYALL